MPNLVTSEFNRMCTEAGVQCTITTQTFGEYLRRYEMANLGKNYVMFSYKGKMHTLLPGNSLVLLGTEDPTIISYSVWYKRVLSE